MKTTANTAGLTDIANRVDAATRLLQGARRLHGREHHPILDMSLRQLGLHIEAIVVATKMIHGHPAQTSRELLTDVSVSLPLVASPVSDHERLLDDYVCCRLGCVVAALRVIESSCHDADDEAMHITGDAMSECIHWIEAARHDLSELIAQGVEASEAA